MDNIAGPPVEGENFFGRQGDIDRLREILRHHDILLLGPRRIGKTSVARAVMAGLRKEGWRAIEINVASCIDERGFLEKLEAALRQDLDSAGGRLWESLRAGFTALGTRIRTVKIPVPGAGSLGIELEEAPAEDWTLLAGEVLSLIGQMETPWLIYIDELPIFLFNLIRADPATGIPRVRRFLDWFRNDVRGLPGSARVRWLVSGSIGLDTLVQQHGMADTINSFRHEGLPPFAEQEASALLLALAGQYQLDFGPGETAGLLAAIQWWQPYYLQLAFHELRGLISARPGEKTANLIEAAVELMVQPGGSNDFHHWEERLSMQLPPADARHAAALLAQAAATRDGVRAETLLATLQGRLPDASEDEARQTFVRLRDILQRDGYWVPEDQGGVRRYRFLLEPLRRWWLRRSSL